MGFMTTNDVFENCNWKIAPAFTILHEYKLYEIFSVLIPNSRIFRDIVVEKMMPESERMVS